MDPQSAHHGHVRDIRITAGKIETIKPTIDTSEEANVWHANGACVSPGWVDLQAHFYEPGAEHKEGLENGALAAANGGFTRVTLNANPHVKPDDRSAVAFLQSHNHSFACSLYPMATISINGEGKSLSEMHDLGKAGAVAFSDDLPIDDTEMLRRALEYADGMQQPIISCPIDMGLNAGAMMHEGATSTHMGITGNPRASEVIRIQRDLEVVKYTGGRLHFSVISTAESVDLIRLAKAQGSNITCATTANHLRYIDEDLSNFDGTLKTMPPFRSEADRKALCNGVIDGTIDAVISDHRPEDLEHHDVEFNLAAFGMASIESTFAITLNALRNESKETALEATIRALSAGPRSVLGYSAATIMPDEPAEMTWFHPDMAWENCGITKGKNVPQSVSPQKGNLLGNPLGTVRGIKLLRRD